MPIKRLRDVQVGDIIPMGGERYKVRAKINMNNDLEVAREVIPGVAYNHEPLTISQLSRKVNGQGLNNDSLVLVDNAPAVRSQNSLTDKLRGQVKQQSLTAKLKAQVDAQDEQDLEDRYGDEDDYDEFNYEPCDDEPDVDKDYGYTYGQPIQQIPLQAIYTEGPTAGEAKVQAAKASLRAQIAQQGAGNASLRAQRAQRIAEDVEADLIGHRDQVEEQFEEVGETLEYFAQQHNGFIDEAKEHFENLGARVSKIEAEKAKEEKQMNAQQALNARLAARKNQQELQAQLDAKLNNKKSTFGGNGSMKNILGSFTGQFGKVEGKFAFSPTTGGLAIRKGHTGQFVAFDGTTITDVQDLVLKFDVPAFSLPTAAGDVKKGDIIRNGDDYGYVTRVNDGFVEVVHVEKNQRGSVLPTKNILMGQSFYTVIKTLDAAGQGGFDPILLMALSKGESKDNLLPLLLMGGANGGAQAGKAGGIDPTMLMLLGDKVDDILPLVLMQQGGVLGGGAQGQGGIQGILPFLLMGDDKSSKDLLPLLAMSGGFGGQQGQAGAMNPMMMMALSGDGDFDPMTMMMLSGGFGGQQGGLFGQQPQAPKAEEKQQDSADQENE